MHKRWLNQTGQVQKFAILWSFVRPHRGKLALALVLSLLTTGVGLATLMVTKWVLDTLEQGISLATPVAALLVLLVLSTATGYVQWVLLGSMAERIVYDAQVSLIHRFFRANLGDSVGSSQANWSPGLPVTLVCFVQRRPHLWSMSSTAP